MSGWCYPYTTVHELLTFPVDTRDPCEVETNGTLVSPITRCSDLEISFVDPYLREATGGWGSDP